jgi:hydroxymethylbilane synthase
MTVLRVGTRGSALALWQASWVSAQLCEARPAVEVEQVIVRTTGDDAVDQAFGPTWPVGAFVSALERALLDGRIDLAVHSLKDLQTHPTDGLCIAAIPKRGPEHDVLITREHIALTDLRRGARIGTSSPRRAAQLRRIGDLEIVPLRGNVPTRIAKLETELLDGIVLAAAGLSRLGISHPNTIELPVDRFLPAPGQGALAVQGCTETQASELAAAIDHSPTRTAITAERSFLTEIGAGCHTPVGALATVAGNSVTLAGCLFSDDQARAADGVEIGIDPIDVGVRLAQRLRSEV